MCVRNASPTSLAYPGIKMSQMHHYITYLTSQQNANIIIIIIIIVTIKQRAWSLDPLLLLYNVKGASTTHSQNVLSNRQNSWHVMIKWHVNSTGAC